MRPIDDRKPIEPRKQPFIGDVHGIVITFRRAAPQACPDACNTGSIAYYAAPPCSRWHRGRSSGVERNLAKVEVVGSNPIARSIFSGPLLDFPAVLLGPLANRMV